MKAGDKKERWEQTGGRKSRKKGEKRKRKPLGMIWAVFLWCVKKCVKEGMFSMVVQ